MVYLVIKELSSVAEDVIMVTSSIMKDMQPNLEVIYRPNAIRALARIIDVSTDCMSTAFTRIEPVPNQTSHIKGFICCFRRTILQVRHCRSKPFYLFCRHRIRIPLASSRERRHSAMGK
jgi:hypothetical protein